MPRRNAPRVLIVGSVHLDVTVTAPRLPGAGETVLGGVLVTGRGGKGANQAVAARRLGAEVRFIGCVGDDAAGQELGAALEAEGIGTAGLGVVPGTHTGTALIVVDARGENQIVVAPGADRALTVSRVRERTDDLDWAEIVVCQLEVPLETVAWTLEEARKRGAMTLLNPAPAPDSRLDFEVDVLTPNAREAERLTGIDVNDRIAAAAAARALVARGARTAVVTLGKDGAVARAGTLDFSVPALPVRVVDTTGAGDAFTAGLTVGLVEDRPLADVLAFASAAAALACTRQGAQASLPRRHEVDDLLMLAHRDDERRVTGEENRG